MNVNRQIAQHRTRLATLRRSALVGGIVTVLLVGLTVSAFALHWHPVVAALLLLPTLGMLAHSLAPYTRMRDHRRKLRELEAQRDSSQE